MESNETIYDVKRRLEDMEGNRSDVVQMFTYEGKRLHDWWTIANYNISEESTLHVVTRKRLPHIYVRNLTRKTITLRIDGLNTIDDVKARIYEQEGIPPEKQRLLFHGRQLCDGNQTLLENHIRMESTLFLVQCHGTMMNREGSQSAPTQLSATSQGRYNLRKRPAPQVAPEQTSPSQQVAPEKTKIARLATQTTPSKTTPNETKHEEERAECIQGLATSADRQAHNNYEEKLKVLALQQAKTTAALNDLMQEIRARPPSSVLTKLEDLKREMTTARSKEKELEATISGLTLKNKVFSCRCASYESQLVALEVENKKTKEDLIVADKKILGARAAGYAEGLDEGKAKWLRSVEFLHHLTDASMKYFNYGFDSCQKQAEQLGFVGQLNKDSALKDAPELKGWESK